MIKRYSPEAGFSEPMEIDSLGKWVKHKDHIKEVERLEGIIKELFEGHGGNMDRGLYSACVLLFHEPPGDV